MEFFAYVTTKNTVKYLGMMKYLNGGTASNNVREIPNLTGVNRVYGSVRQTLYFLMLDGTVKVIGENNNGQLGLGHKNPVTEITTIPNLNNVKSIAVGSNCTLFLLNDGTVKGCGHNSYYILSNDENYKYEYFTSLIDINISDVKYIRIDPFAMGGVIYLLNNGDTYSAGNGYNGNLFEINANPLKLEKRTKDYNHLENIKDIKTCNQVTFVLYKDDTVRCCGNNLYGRLGLGPGQTGEMFMFNYINNSRIMGTDIKDVFVSPNQTYLLKNDNTILCCGQGKYQLTTYDNKALYAFDNMQFHIYDNKKVINMYCDDERYYVLFDNNTMICTGSTSHGCTTRPEQIINYDYLSVYNLVMPCYDVQSLMNTEPVEVYSYLIDDGNDNLVYPDSKTNKIDIITNKKNMDFSRNLGNSSASYMFNSYKTITSTMNPFRMYMTKKIY